MNFPIKYAVLELKERGGWAVNYANITQGFIVAKCYVIESNIKYNTYGNYEINHKVFFPFKDIETFRVSLDYGKQNIGSAKIPRYNACNEVWPVDIVTELFDTYEEAKASAIKQNEEYKNNLILKVPSPKVWNKENITNVKNSLDILKQEFEERLKISNLFEQLVLEETKDLVISKELESNIKILKPINNKQ